jgi:hypothetical protein
MRRRNPDDEALLRRLTVEVNDYPSAALGKKGSYKLVTAKDRGRIAGSLFVKVERKYATAREVKVELHYRRKGVASWLYRWVENRYGVKVLHSSDQTLDGKAFARGRRHNPDLRGLKVPEWIVSYCRMNYDWLVGLGVDMSKKPYGVGHFGCAFPHATDDRWVVKLTRDPAEGPAARLMIRLQKEGAYGVDGCVKFQSVAKGPDVVFRGKTWPTHVIVRENVDPLSRSNNWSKSEEFTKQVYWWLGTAQTAARNYARLKTLHLKDKAYGEYATACNRLSANAPYLSEFMMAAIDYFGKPLTDVHSGNVGFTLTNWGDDERPPGTLVAFDLGHSAPDSEE